MERTSRLAHASSTNPLLASCAFVAAAVLACGPRDAEAPSVTPVAAGAYRFAQHGQGCSPTDGYADVYTFTRVDRDCKAQAGDEVLIVEHWGARNQRHVVIRGFDHGQARTCIAERGGCKTGRGAELRLPAGAGTGHLRAELEDGSVVESDFVLRECPNQKETCG